MAKIRVRTLNEVIQDSELTIQEVSKKYIDNDKYFFDVELARKYIKFIAMLRHTAGEFAGQTFQLLPFQVEFICESLCVLSKETGFRKHKTAILHISRKNGKSEFLGAIIVLMYFMDNEKSKEIYTIASETEQAKIVFKVAQSMIKQTGYFEKFVNIYKSTRSIESKGEFTDILKVLTANADTKDGLRCNVLIADEAHSYKDDSLFKVVEESMISRRQPITFIISTAGYNIEGMYYQKLQYAKKVKEGIIKDDSMYSMIFEADPKNWEDEKEWLKANPAIGYGVRIENLRDMYIKALHSGTERVSFLTKHLNIWTSSSDTFIADEVWQKNMGELPPDEYLRKLPAYGGLDLSSNKDLTAFVTMFVDKPKNKIYIKCKTYLPKDNLRERSRNDEVPYENWVKDGFLTLTEGNCIDHEKIRADVLESYSKYKYRLIAYDAWGMEYLAPRLLADRVNLVSIRFGSRSMNGPTKALERLALSETFVSNDPVLRWCISNLIIIVGTGGDIKPDKSKTKQKIDVAVALIMAIAGGINEIEKESAYATRGLRML